MNAENFLKHLLDAMPRRDSLEEYGLENDEIDEIQATFMAIIRKSAREERGGEIQRMIAKFDCSRIEIGLIRFRDKPRSHSKGMMFAFCEADLLVEHGDGSIAMYDHANPDCLQMECAVNSERFFDALAQFIDIRSNKSAWKGRVLEAAELCADAAGGSQYREFFRLLCGFVG